MYVRNNPETHKLGTFYHKQLESFLNLSICLKYIQLKPKILVLRAGVIF